MTFVSPIESVYIPNKSCILKININAISKWDSLVKMVISSYIIPHAHFVDSFFMILISSKDILNVNIRNALFVIKTQNNSSMYTLKIMNKLLCILKNLIFIVKLVLVWRQNFRMFLSHNKR